MRLAFSSLTLLGQIRYKVNKLPENEMKGNETQGEEKHKHPYWHNMDGFPQLDISIA